jgi:hypothetical protein
MCALTVEVLASRAAWYKPCAAHERGGITVSVCSLHGGAVRHAQHVQCGPTTLTMPYVTYDTRVRTALINQHCIVVYCPTYSI